MTKEPDNPGELEIQSLSKPPLATICVPGSKSITNRALVLAALAEGPSVLHGALRSEDTELMVAALQQLGFGLDIRWPTVRVEGRAGQIPRSTADLFVGNSGTTMRFLTAMVVLGNGRYRLDGVPRMRERPIQDLLDALQQLGVTARSEQENGCPPVIVESAGGIHGGRVRVRADVSSQFLSGLLMAAPLADQPIDFEVEGPLVSEPYIDMTVAMLGEFGVEVESGETGRLRVAGRQRYKGRSYAIEPDASAASYFFGAAAITGGKVTIPGFGSRSLQGDVRFVELLEEMGCTVGRGDAETAVHGGRLRGIDVDMHAISDTVMTLAAVACFAEGPTTIRNVAHIRHKETDRLTALATELQRVGAGIDEHADGLTIHPRPLHGAAIDTYNDHRLAMSMSLLGLRIPGIIIKNPGCVAKTYPEYFRDLERLRG
jgi:3-phosphoshikimate 1-carboxyvinyltransferase